MKVKSWGFSLVLLLLFVSLVPSLKAAPPDGPDFLKTGIWLKNNTFLPKKVTVISYGPFQSGQTTEVITLLPGQKIRRKYLLGTKLYLADKEQVEAVKSGERLDEQEPFLLVRVRDKDTIYKLFD